MLLVRELGGDDVGRVGRADDTPSGVLLDRVLMQRAIDGVVLLCLACSTATAETWSMAGATRISPFEDFPRIGFTVDALARVQPRMHVGAQLTYYMPREYGDVRRTGLRIEAKLHSPMLEKGRVRWYIEAAVGLGRFHDDFTGYQDLTRTVPGVSLATGVEVRISEHVRPFVAVGGVTYFSTELTNGQWVEGALGLRVPFQSTDLRLGRGATDRRQREIRDERLDAQAGGGRSTSGDRCEDPR